MGYSERAAKQPEALQKETKKEERMKEVRFYDLELILARDYRLYNRKSWKSVSPALKHLRSFFGRIHPRNYHPGLIKDYQEKRLREGAAPATVNREVSYLKRTMGIAFSEGLLPLQVKFKLLPEENVREGIFESKEFYRVVGGLPEDYQDYIEFLFLSCWRAGKARSLTWDRVFLDAPVPCVRPEKGSGHKMVGESLPLLGSGGKRTRLFEIFERRNGARVEGCPFVFHRNGKPIGDIRKAWRSALKSAGLAGNVVHDLRRSGAVHLSRAGVSEEVIMKRAGWKTRAVFTRYRIVKPIEQQKANEAYEAYLSN